ncbi:MAG: DMT family transporter [Oscillospiraceae bacterium]|nr:DMT family transporter [Oscillospiraceae bacterium]
MRKQLKGSLTLLLATAIWGSTFIFQRLASDSIGPFTFQATRCLLGALVLLPVIFLFDLKKRDGKNYFSRWADKKLWLGGLLCGVPLFLACNLQQIGIADTDAGKSAFLTAMYIVIVPLIGLLLKKKVTIAIPISVGLAVIGLYFLSCMGVSTISISDLLLVGCAVMFAVQITFVDIFAGKVDPLRLNVTQVLVCTVLSAISAVCFKEEITWQAVSGNWLPIAYAGILSMGAAYCMQILGQRDVEPATASLIMSMEAVFAVLCGVMFLEETMTKWEIIGCCFMFIAVILPQIPLKSYRK